MTAPRAGQITVPRSERPMLTVVVDTEEEFDWSLPFDRNAVGTRHMAQIGRLQSVFENCGVQPTYVVDYPVASREEGIRPLAEMERDGKALIGAHLHTWVTPPFEEELNRRNSFQGNLPRELEAGKLSVLGAVIEERLGRRPVIFKAGRYGIGPNTYEILEEQGFEIDLSPAPPHDFSAEGGPDFSRWRSDPFSFGQSGRLLCLPSTGALAGWLGPLAPRAYKIANQLIRVRVPGILARCNAVDRISLSPEGHTLAEMIKVTRFLFARGLRVFTMSLHSPSCAPGFTPYVRTESDLSLFLDCIRRYIEYFCRELNGVCMDVLEIRRKLASITPSPRGD